MWQRSEPSMNLPAVEVTASTPLRANFDSDYRKGPTSLYEPSDVDDGKDTSIESSKPQWNTIFHLNREPLPEHSDIYFRKSDWRSIGNILLAIYATFFSGLSLAVAVRQPRYGKWISPTGPLTPSTADLLFSLFSKSIEIASAGVYITFLGQFLTRRSLRSRGIRLTDIALREWLLQPGFVIWNWDNLKFAATTVLGCTTLLAATGIFFFTTASNTLVSPHIALGQSESARFSGIVRQDFGNNNLLKTDCWRPILLDAPGNLGESCVAVLAVGLSDQDLNDYMKRWSEKTKGGGSYSSDFSNRPGASSSIFTDTKVQGSWVHRNSSSISINFNKHGRVVNNITLSMPHPVVYYSAKTEFPDPIKGTGFGEHTVEASVVSPTTNTLCVNMNESEVAPLVYVEFPNARLDNNTRGGRKIAVKDWFNDLPGNTSLRSNLSQTHVEDIFRWGPAYNRKPPVFQQWPIDHNSVANISVPNSDSVYLLIKSPSTRDYTICQMYGYLSQGCSTRHTQKIGTSSLISDCSANALSFQKSIAPASFRPGPSTDFRDILGSWSLALGLNGGINSNNGSVTRVLSKLVITNSSGITPSFNTTLPSISEALAVLSSSMLIKASINATFDNRTIKDAPTDPQSFPYNVIVQNQQYRSGPPATWQCILYPILVIIFVANFYCLTYFLRELGLVVDFLDPQNLFSVAIDSPDESKKRVAGEGPVANHDGVAWNLRRDDDRRLVFRRRRVEKVALNEKTDLDDNWI